MAAQTTPRIAEKFAPGAQIIETDIASKSNALNIGLEKATVYPTVFLDADITTTTQAIAPWCIG